MTFDGFAEHTPIHQQVEKHTHQRERSLITDRVQGEVFDLKRRGGRLDPERAKNVIPDVVGKSLTGRRLDCLPEKPVADVGVGVFFARPRHQLRMSLQYFLQSTLFMKCFVFFSAVKPFQRQGIGNSRSLREKMPNRDSVGVGMRRVIDA
jgi:hypothetical protein